MNSENKKKTQMSLFFVSPFTRFSFSHILEQFCHDIYQYLD